MRSSCIAKHSIHCEGSVLFGGMLESISCAESRTDDFVVAIKDSYAPNEFGLYPICLACLKTLKDEPEYRLAAVLSSLCEGFINRI